MIHVLNEPLPDIRAHSPGKRRPPAPSKSRTQLANQFYIPEPVKLPHIKDDKRSEAERPTASSSPKVQAATAATPAGAGNSDGEAAANFNRTREGGDAETRQSESAGGVESSARQGVEHTLDSDMAGTSQGRHEDSDSVGDLPTPMTPSLRPGFERPPPPTPALIELLSVGEALPVLSPGGVGGPPVDGSLEVPDPPNELLIKEIGACLRCPMTKMRVLAAEKCGRLARHHFSMMLPTGVIQMMLNMLDHEKPKSPVSRTVVSSIAEMSVVVDARAVVAPHANKVVQVLTDGQKGGRERTCLAIMNLVIDESCREIMLRADVVPSLLAVIRENGLGEQANMKGRTLTYAAGALANLVNNSGPAALEAIAAAEGGVDTLVRLLAVGEDTIATQRIGLVVARLKAEVPGSAEKVHSLAEELNAPDGSATPARRRKSHPREAGKRVYHPTKVLHPHP
mmetsp:Transcript_40822/g.73365  ORF Transcript_40822/g.73365 Transcript_40822/m.73365 type:complete len:454 (-) Transcript_40822:226-1587(-)